MHHFFNLCKFGTRGSNVKITKPFDSIDAPLSITYINFHSNPILAMSLSLRGFIEVTVRLNVQHFSLSIVFSHRSGHSINENKLTKMLAHPNKSKYITIVCAISYFFVLKDNTIDWPHQVMTCNLSNLSDFVVGRRYRKLPVHVVKIRIVQRHLILVKQHLCVVHHPVRIEVCCFVGHHH